MRKLFSFFMGDDSKDNKNSSAKVAKERLQILIAKDGGNGILSDEVLRKIEYEILEIVKKYIKVSEDNIDIKVEHENGMDILGLNITLNEETPKK
jgi:cell division topological specificity factor